jgi:cbb3-type cytochrome c oxidase subunit I
MSTNIERFAYDNKIVKKFAFATALWGAVGMLVGVIIALQLVFPALNFDFPLTTYGRLRPLHTNAVIFAFVGNGIFMGVYYSLQRLTKARMWSDKLSNLHFWGWQLIIVLAALTLVFGITTGKEYAELEWPIDILITLIWVVFGLNMFMTIIQRRERHLYVAIWFFIATWVTVAMLHIVNSFELPVSLTKELFMVCRCSGCIGAMVVWSQCCGILPHHAVPRIDVLLRSESCESSCIFLQTFDHSLLGFDLPLYLGWSSPLVILFTS